MSEIRDQQWQIVQEKAFTAWMNETLVSQGIKVTDLRQDLADGVKLAQFFQLLSGKKIHTKIETKPVNRIQKIQNLHIALTFLEAEMLVKNPGCSAEDVADAPEHQSKVKLILGLLWTVYRRFRIATITVQDKSSEEGLLLWVKQATNGYADVHIENFKNSFKDGMAFVALVHSFDPKKTKIDLGAHSKHTPEHNLSVAFELAEQELGIPKLLDVKEVFEGRVDERSLVLYTSLFFHAFKAAEAANNLTREKLSTEESLARERKRNEELHQQNSLLISELESLKLQFEDLNRKKFELTKQYEEEKSEITLTLHQKEETTLQLQNKIEEKTEETLKLQRLVQEKHESALQFQNKLQELQGILEEERNETSLQLDNYQKKNLELSEQLHEEQTRRLELESKVTDLSSSLNENQETNLQVITELRKKQGLYEEEIESLKNDVENFKAQLDNERRENNQHHQALQERTEQDNFHRKGLQVLHKNLDEHIVDLHTWQKYLDSKDRNWLDFDREVLPSLNNELSTRNDFIEELNLLSDKLEQENEAMLQIFKVKAAEIKNAQVEAAKQAETKK